MSIDDIGSTVTWREACWLTEVILESPESVTASRLAGWDFPASREWMVLAAQYDDFRSSHAKKSRKPKPWPRPWPAPGTKRFGRTRKPIPNIREHLRRMAGR